MAPTWEEMVLVGAAAYLHLCPDCQPHAWLVCTDGSRTRDYATKKMLRATAEHLRKCNKITKDELVSLKQQIDDASLPEESEDLEAMMTSGIASHTIVAAQKLSRRLYAAERKELAEDEEGELPVAEAPESQSDARAEGDPAIVPGDLSRFRVLN